MGVINSTLVIRVTTALADASIKCEGTATRRYVLKIASSLYYVLDACTNNVHNTI